MTNYCISRALVYSSTTIAHCALWTLRTAISDITLFTSGNATGRSKSTIYHIEPHTIVLHVYSYSAELFR